MSIIILKPIRASFLHTNEVYYLKANFCVDNPSSPCMISDIHVSRINRLLLSLSSIAVSRALDFFFFFSEEKLTLKILDLLQNWITVLDYWKTDCSFYRQLKMLLNIVIIYQIIETQFSLQYSWIPWCLCVKDMCKIS